MQRRGTETTTIPVLRKRFASSLDEDKIFHARESSNFGRVPAQISIFESQKETLSGRLLILERGQHSRARRTVLEVHYAYGGDGLPEDVSGAVRWQSRVEGGQLGGARRTDLEVKIAGGGEGGSFPMSARNWERQYWNKVFLCCANGKQLKKSFACVGNSNDYHLNLFTAYHHPYLLMISSCEFCSSIDF